MLGTKPLFLQGFCLFLAVFLQNEYFFIFYTLLNAIFYTANNISYSALTSLITKNPNERVQMGTFRFIGSTIGTAVVSNYALVLVDKFGGGAVGWKWTAVVFAVIGLVINTFSVFSVKELPEEELNEGRRWSRSPPRRSALLKLSRPCWQTSTSTCSLSCTFCFT